MIHCIEIKWNGKSEKSDRRSTTKQDKIKTNIWICAISAIGVIFLKRVRIVSKHAGIYLSKKITRFDFSVDIFRVSIHDVTYGFHPKSPGFIYKIPARLTCIGNRREHMQTTRREI